MNLRLLPLALLCVLPLLSACAAGVTVMGAGAGMFADWGLDHILKSSASKTFPAPLEEVHAAMLRSLHRMELVVESDERTDSGYAVTGQAHGRRVEVALEEVGGQFTYAEVNVKRNFFWRDRATADALVVETDSVLVQLRLANQNGLPHIPVAGVLRPIPARWTPSGTRRSDAAGAGPPAPLALLSASALASDISQIP